MASLIAFIYIIDFTYILIVKKINLIVIFSLSLAIFTTIGLYFNYRHYKKAFDFDIRIDDEGIYFKIPQLIAQYHELEVEKGKYLWKQIRNVIYDSESNIIYLILISKIKIPIPIVNMSKKQIEETLKQIKKYTSIEVV